MRIAQISTVCTPVRPSHSGSVETIVWLLSRELARLGHEVTVFGCGGSEVDESSGVRFVETLPSSYGDGGAPDDWTMCEWINLSRALSQSDEFDIVHSHVYMWGLTMQGLSAAPMVNTLHILPYDDDAQVWRLHPDARVTGISTYQWQAYPDLQPLATIPHGVAVEQFDFREDCEDYLLYLGRFIENKGPLDAIELAQHMGCRLVLAGPRSDYFDHHIARLVDGRRIVYAGAVDSMQRSSLLGGAMALIYPLREPEPFGLVQVEAMLCGTPVVAPRLGAVPEIIEDGITGFMSEPADLTSLADATKRAFRLDRSRIRETAKRRFSAARMAEDYLALYGSIVQNAGHKATIKEEVTL
jgi:glycosyltransferase involved in cell wall biosynthesis